MDNKVKLLIATVFSLLAGLIGSLFTFQAIPTWYQQLNKPEFTPPNWIFGPVWTLLYILIGVALYLVWQKGIEKRKVKIAVGLFVVQWVLNIAWTWLFFGMQNPQAAFTEIIVLWISILITTVYFYKLSKPAGLLFIPYLLWVSFATYLNYSILQLNS